MHDISHEHVLKMCVHTPRAQSHSLASIEPIQEPRKKNKELQQINIIKIRRKAKIFFGWVGGEATSLAIISTARSPWSTGRPSSTDELYAKVAFTRGLNAAGPIKGCKVIKLYKYMRKHVIIFFAVIINKSLNSIVHFFPRRVGSEQYSNSPFAV